jgi:hypothetical protein
MRLSTFPESSRPHIAKSLSPKGSRSHRRQCALPERCQKRKRDLSRAPKLNPHLAAIAGNLEWRTERDRGQAINVHPRVGESATYGRINDADLNAAEDYVLVDRVPGVEPSGPNPDPGGGIDIQQPGGCGLSDSPHD